MDNNNIMKALRWLAAGAAFGIISTSVRDRRSNFDAIRECMHSAYLWQEPGKRRKGVA